MRETETQEMLGDVNETVLPIEQQIDFARECRDDTGRPEPWSAVFLSLSAATTTDHGALSVLSSLQHRPLERPWQLQPLVGGSPRFPQLFILQP